MIRLLLLVSLLLSLFARAEEIPPWLTLNQARAIALKKHPRITIADLKTLAAKKVVGETTAALFPAVTVVFGGAVAADANTRVVGNPLTVSSVLDRAGPSVLVSQLIADFGRTWHLRSSSVLKAEAEQKGANATRAQILLQVDGAYFAALQAKSLLLVAENTVQTRRFLRDQIATLAKNELKSEFDASFAETDFQEAVLLQSKARNDLESAYATLAALLDEPRVMSYRLAASPDPGPLPNEPSGLVTLAIQNRPDLQKFRLEGRSAREFAKAEAALSFPTLSAQATAGVLPWRDATLGENYAAAGVVVSWPVFAGGYNMMKRQEADARAKAAETAVHDEENNAIKEVRLSWLACRNALERVAITATLESQAEKTLALARARYDAGSSSIVELSQSQLNLTANEIAHTNARYEYLARRSMLEYNIGLLH